MPKPLHTVWVYLAIFAAAQGCKPRRSASTEKGFFFSSPTSLLDSLEASEIQIINKPLDLSRRGIGFLMSLETVPFQGSNINIPTRVASENIKSVYPSLFRLRFGSSNEFYKEILQSPGSRIQIILSDLYAAKHLEWYSSNTNWPGDNGQWEAWDNVITEVLNWLETFELKDRIDLDIWNEPDYCPGNSQVRTTCTYWKRDFMRFIATYERAFKLIKSKSPETRVVGPSAAGFDYKTFAGLQEGFVKEFLKITKTKQVLPDVVSFHELADNNGANLKKRVDTVRGMTSAQIPISINEVLHPEVHQKSATMISYFAAAELAGIESSSRACWPDPSFTSKVNDPAKNQCHLANLDGLLTISNPQSRRSSWWVLNEYADMKGTVVFANPLTSNGLAMLVSHSAAASEVNVLIGNLSNSTKNLKISKDDLLALTGHNYSMTAGDFILFEAVSPLDSTLPVASQTGPDDDGEIVLPTLKKGMSVSVRLSLN